MRTNKSRETGANKGGVLMKRAVVLLFACLCVLSASGENKAERRVTPDQARVLVLAALTPKQRQLPSLETDSYNNPDSSRFLFFSVTWGKTANGSEVVGSYAVDPFTGDVFSATATCHEEKNKNLEALQKQFRATLNLTQAEYQRLKTKGPRCGD
jgi:hypothetical protein